MGNVTNRTSQPCRKSDFSVIVTSKNHFFLRLLYDALGIQATLDNASVQTFTPQSWIVSHV
jgi:hypothetical protein